VAVPRLTAAQARAAGIPVPKRPGKDRREAKGPYLTVCRTCDTRFTTRASEDRHLHDTHHIRYDVITEPEGT
jgi:hypothetical protein